jgi:hypothetical protein
MRKGFYDEYTNENMPSAMGQSSEMTQLRLRTTALAGSQCYTEVVKV